MKRRDFLTAAPVAALAPLVVASDAGVDASVPFLSAIADVPNVIALCFPASRITCDDPFLLNDGRVIWCDCGRVREVRGEWRKMRPQEFEGRIIGRVISLQVRGSRDGWLSRDTGWLA